MTLTELDGLGRPVTTIVNYQNGVVGSDEPVDQDLISRSRYDRAGRLIETVDPAGRVTQFDYDLQDRLVAVTENVTTDCAPTATDCNTTMRYQYDRVGNRTAIIDANGHVRRFSYDAASQQVEAVDGLDRRTGWSYDQGGRMVAQDDPRGATNDLTWTYDGLDRMTGIDATNLDAIGISYDVLGRRTTLTDGTGTTTFTPDPLGRVTQVTAPDTGTVGYSYTARGERSQLTYPDGTVVDYRYLADGRLDTVTEGSTTLADYGYDALGRLDQATMGNGVVTSYTYDNADRLRDLHTTVGGSTVTRFEYEVDRLGLRTQATETLSDTVRTIDYDYDGLLRLTGATESPGTSYSYSYDRVGNRTDGGQQYNAANEVVGFTYDEAGNLLNDGSTSYTYDALGRLTQQGGTSYSYNGDGVLVGRGTTSYTQDLVAPLEQVLNDGTTNLVYGHTRITSSDGTWYQHDGLGSVRAVLDGAGAIQFTTSYDPWGVPTAGSTDPFGFTGELHDGDLVHLRARWYHTSQGRFMTRDAWPGTPMQPASLHGYMYTDNNPINAVDPTGFRTFRIWTAAFIAPASINFVYQGGDWGAGVWKGDDRGFWDMKGPRPSSRIWAEVTIDTDADTGFVAHSLQSDADPTVVHFLKDGQLQGARATAQDEAQITVVRERDFILVRLQNWGPNPLTPPLVTPKIHYDYNLVFDLKRKRVIVVGDVSRYPSHELHIEDTVVLGHVPNYAGGANPGQLALLTRRIEPLAMPLPLEHHVGIDDCALPNPQAWAMFDVHFRMHEIHQFFERPPWLPE